MKLKWFKLATDLFDNFKMKYISSLENGKVIMLIWVKLLCLAAKKNGGGAIYIVRNKLTTAKELSILLDESADTITEAIGIFSELDMIRFDGIGNIVIKNFDEFQWGEGEDEAEDAEENIIEDEAQRKKELARQRKLRWKQKQKAEQINNENDSVPPAFFERSPSVPPAFPERSGSVPPAFHERSGSVPPAFHERSNSVPERSPINYNIRGEEIREENNRIDYILSEERRDICSLCDAQRDMPVGVGGEAYGVGSQSAAEGNLYHDRSASIPPSSPKNKGRGIYKNVFISDTEYSRLKSLYPESIDRLIEELSTYLKTSGKQYESHSAALSRWALRNKKEAEEAVRANDHRYNSKAEVNEDCGGSFNSKAEVYKGCGESLNSKKKVKERYGDFDPAEAMLRAIERSGFKVTAEDIAFLRGEK